MRWVGRFLRATRMLPRPLLSPSHLGEKAHPLSDLACEVKPCKRAADWSRPRGLSSTALHEDLQERSGEDLSNRLSYVHVGRGINSELHLLWTQHIDPVVGLSLSTGRNCAQVRTRLISFTRLRVGNSVQAAGAEDGI